MTYELPNEHLSESLRRLPEATASDGFTAAVLSRLAETTARGDETAGGGPTAPWITLPRLATLAVAVVALVLATVVLTGPGGLTRWSGERVADAPAAATATAPDSGHSASDPATDPATDPGADPKAGGAPPAALSAAGDRTDGLATRQGPPDETPPARLALAESPLDRDDSDPRTPAADPNGLAGVAADGGVQRAALAGRRGLGAGGGSGEAADAGLDADERRRAVERLRELRRQQRELRARLAAFTEEPAAPTVILGGDESLELVLDLGADARFGNGPGYGARPATYRPDSGSPRYF